MQESVRAELLAEQPKIDAAIKSFASFLLSGMANTSTIEDGAQLTHLQDVLSVSRSFSKFINQHIAPIRKADLDDARKEAMIVTWNYLVASNQKPTKHLGRSALSLVWQGIQAEFAENYTCTDVDQEKIQFYLHHFQQILLDEDSDDSRLIWAVDGGEKELERRASERNERAKANRQRSNKQAEGKYEKMPSTIEEEDEESDEDIHETS